METKKAEKVFNRFTRSKQIHEAVLYIENTKADFAYQNAYGAKNIDSPLLMASITKLFTTSCILILREQGELSLDDKLTKYFDQKLLDRLHVFKGQDYSNQLTINHLLFQTSELPDIFEESKVNLKKRLIAQDMAVSFDDLVLMTKELKPHFPPNSFEKAYYADINFDLLGKVIEFITHQSLAVTFKEFIFKPLGLKHTYLPIDENDFVPKIYYKDTALERPQYIQSCHASGGAISTATELMTFIKAFFNGQLFRKDIFTKLKKYSKMQISMYPIQYGLGHMRIPMSGLSMAFMGKGELLGHSGSSGSFAFYYPDKDLFIVGDLNQMANPALPIRISMQLAMSF